MDDERTIGLVTRIYPLTETSLIFHCLTESCGRIGLVARGARKPKSPFTGKIDLYYKVDIAFGRSSKSELHQVRELELLDPNTHLRMHLDLLQQATYINRLVDLATETETPLDEIYTRFDSFITNLKSSPARAESIIAMEYDLLTILGLSPALEGARLGPVVQRFFGNASARDEKLEPRYLAEANRFLRNLIIGQLGKIPAGRDAALLF
ncbi:MAG: Recombination protein RecO [Verrucomicrobiales bacterium]|nr:Recombination protein RecO [Verrucomicrobiales bacterium]MDB6130185.1 Recombination protein RecO [Verrucomicrobiales bacterium]